MFCFYTSWKCQKTKGFLTFSGGIEIVHWVKMGWKWKWSEQKVVCCSKRTINVWEWEKNDFQRGNLFFQRWSTQKQYIWVEKLQSSTSQVKYSLFNPSLPDADRWEKINLNFYCNASFWCFKRFYEGLKGLHKTFLSTTKYENKNSS